MGRQDIIKAAERWLGARWHHQACVPYVLVDCGQLLNDVFARCGFIDKVETQFCPRDWAAHRNSEQYLLDIVERHAQPVSTPLPGDVAVWKFGRVFSHLAIVIDWPCIIHVDFYEGVTYADASKGKLATHELRFYSVFNDEASL